MWRFKPFMHKEHTGLEGRTLDIGNYKVQVGNVIAEGGFSTVYLSQDALDSSKQYALKHIICSDGESKDLVMKEVSVMKTLKGHPNVVTLYSHVIFDTGRSKEALLLMEYCEKSLVSVLESRGSGFFEEKQILKIFRDVCNAVFSMHCQTPAIAHRDLKAENLLLGSDDLWKLCDFGSTSTNHKRFLKPEEMGIEEDNIRKHTTPAYRAPEMWDLYRRELINEKVDIWALGCLLFRICYLKLAFDGESKLQVLNGNYRIPDLPKYNLLLTDLIREMLQSSPDNRPDITQVWFRVNDLLPDGLRKSLPDRPPEMKQNGTDVSAGISKPANKSSPMPRRSPPPPPSDVSPAPNNVRTGRGESTGVLGAFWDTPHAKEAQDRVENTRPKYDEDMINHKSSGNEKICIERLSANHVSLQEQGFQYPGVPKNVQGRSSEQLNLFPDDFVQLSKPEAITTYQTDAFNSLAQLNADNASFSNNHREPQKYEPLEALVEKLARQLAQASAEKAEIISKYEKLSAICRSQWHEIQELKHALAARTPSPSRDSLRNAASTGSQSSPIPLTENMDGTTTSPDAQQWQAFTDDSKPNYVPTKYASKSVRTRNSQRQKNQAAEPASGANIWGFETDGFQVVPASSSKSDTPVGESYNSYGIGEPKNGESKLNHQPAGWAGF